MSTDPSSTPSTESTQDKHETNGEKNSEIEKERSDGLTIIKSISKGGLFKAPAWTAPAPLPSLHHAVLECYKQEGIIMKHLRMGKSVTNTFGRNEELCDHCVQHPSISRQHAALIHTTSPTSPFVIVDLYSSHGTYVGDQKLQPGHPRALKDNDVIHFGASTRKYKVKGTSSSSSSSSSKSSSSSSKDVKSSDRDRKRPREDEHKDSTTSTTSSSKDAPPKKKSTKETVTARHILVKHAKSRRPQSHKSPKIERTLEEAITMIEAIRKRIVEGGEDFAKVAEQESDCSSYKKGGDLGPFTREAMQPSFSNCAFSLSVGQISDIVTTDSGVHIIQRTA